MAGDIELFCLQHWIPSRTVNDEGNYWNYDLTQLFTTQEQAETERSEFHSEGRTRIVRMKLIEVDVVGEFAE